MSLIAEEIGPLTKGAVNVTSFSLIDFDGKAYKSMSVNWHLKYKHADINLMKSVSTKVCHHKIICIVYLIFTILLRNCCVSLFNLSLRLFYKWLMLLHKLLGKLSLIECCDICFRLP